MLSIVRTWARGLKRDVHAVYLAARDPRTPWYARAAAMLVASGLKAAPVTDGRGVLAREGEAWSYALRRMDRDIVKGFPFQIDEAPLAIERDVPHVGEHTAEVLTGIGGYSPAEVEAFAAAGIVEVRKPSR